MAQMDLVHQEQIVFIIILYISVNIFAIFPGKICDRHLRTSF